MKTACHGDSLLAPAPQQRRFPSMRRARAGLLSPSSGMLPKGMSSPSRRPTSSAGVRTAAIAKPASYSQGSMARDGAEDSHETQQLMAPYPRASIIATIGPDTPIEDCVEAGMRVMRLNCSHGDASFYKSKVDRLRDYLASRPNKDSLDPETGITVNCAVAFDLKGPEIRTGQLEELGGQVDLKPGDRVILTTEASLQKTGAKGDVPQVYVDYENITNVLDVGSPVFIDDGLLQLEVSAVHDDRVECVAQNSGSISERKGVNLPGAIVDLPAVGDKDVEDIKLAAEMGADFVFASFVRKREHVASVRKILAEAGSPATKIISKIENQEGLDNFSEILDESDGIMVARGDLGIEIPAHKVVTAQKMMIAECNVVGKPVVCATQMLESMVQNPRATRAEVSDVANAVLDGADCVMLSGETAKGKFPVEAIETMGRTCREADNLVNYGEVFHRIAAGQHRHGPVESICAAAVRCAVDERASMIVVVTTDGDAAQYVSKYRPPMPVLVATDCPMVARQSFMLRGITPLLLSDMRNSHLICVEDSCSIDDDEAPELVLQGALEYGKRMGICRPGDNVVAVVASFVHRDDLMMRTLAVRE